MKKTVLDVPNMDCAAEERVVRMALQRLDEVARIDSDLGRRRVTVVHEGEPDQLVKRLATIHFSARFIETGEAVLREFSGPNDPSPPVRDRKAMQLLFAITAVMFFVEIIVGWLADSIGLIADALDMLADAAVYGVSLYAAGKAAGMQPRATRLSGYLLLILATGALLEVIRRFLVGSDPDPSFMIGIALLALVANLSCMAVIAKHRQDGIQRRPSWIFSISATIANIGVIVAGLLVAWTGSHLPDLAAGFIIALVVLSGAIRILRLSRMPAPPVDRVEL